MINDKYTYGRGKGFLKWWDGWGAKIQSFNDSYRFKRLMAIIGLVNIVYNGLIFNKGYDQEISIYKV